MPKTARATLRSLVGGISLVGLIGLAGAPAEAKLFKLGDEKPLVSIDIPENWSPSTIEDGVEANSPDKETYVAAEVVEASDLDAALKAEGKFFRKSKITLKTETEKKKEITFGELKGFDIQWMATDEDGPTHVSVTLLQVNDKNFMMVTYWGSATGEESNGATLDGIAKSVKLIK